VAAPPGSISTAWLLLEEVRSVTSPDQDRAKIDLERRSTR
jgi:hypothetical protein